MSNIFEPGMKILAPHYSSNHLEADLPATIIHVKTQKNILIQFDNPKLGWIAEHQDVEPGIRISYLSLWSKYNKSDRAYWINDDYGIEQVKIIPSNFISVINSLKNGNHIPNNFQELITEYLTQKAK